MKTTLQIVFVLAFALSLVSCSSSLKTTAEYDDVYYQPSDQPVVAEATPVAVQRSTAPAEKMDDYEKYIASLEDKPFKSSEYTDESLQYTGDTVYYAEDPQYIDTTNYEEQPVYITNNYYNTDDYYYASRIRRFYDPFYSFGYYDPWYCDPYWYSPGWSFSYGFGYPYWHYGFSYGYPYWYNPYYYYGYYDWYYPYYGSLTGTDIMTDIIQITGITTITGRYITVPAGPLNRSVHQPPPDMPVIHECHPMSLAGEQPEVQTRPVPVVPPCQMVPIVLTVRP